MKKEMGFYEAITALQNGKRIRRKSGISSFCYRKIEMLGTIEIEYGKIDYEGQYTKGMYFDEKDIFADDWIIEEK